MHVSFHNFPFPLARTYRNKTGLSLLNSNRLQQND